MLEHWVLAYYISDNTFSHRRVTSARTIGLKDGENLLASRINKRRDQQ